MCRISYFAEPTTVGLQFLCYEYFLIICRLSPKIGVPIICRRFAAPLLYRALSFRISHIPGCSCQSAGHCVPINVLGNDVVIADAQVAEMHFPAQDPKLKQTFLFDLYVSLIEISSFAAHKEACKY